MSRLKVAKMNLGIIEKIDSIEDFMNRLKKIFGAFEFQYKNNYYLLTNHWGDHGTEYVVMINRKEEDFTDYDKAMNYLKSQLETLPDYLDIKNKTEGDNKMSRLKLANHVSPFMHEKVNQHITSEPSGIQTKVEQSSVAFVIAKELMAALPLVPANEVLYNLVQDIEMGHYDDISNLEDAMKDENWENWKERTKELLIAKGLLVKTSRLRKLAKGTDLGDIKKIDIEEIKKTWAPFEFTYNDNSYSVEKDYTEDKPQFIVKVNKEEKSFDKFKKAMDYLESILKD